MRQCALAVVLMAAFTVVTGVDDTPPVVQCGPDITKTIPVSTAGLAIRFPDCNATDNSGTAVLVSRTHVPGGFFTTGSVIVTYTFTDPSGNTASGSFRITVLEDTRESTSDFTCINSNPFYKRYSDIYFIAAGPGTPPIKFRRYQTTGKNQRKMPKGSTESIGEDIVYRQILKKKKKSGEAIRNGVFSCTTTSGGKNTVIPVFSHLKTNTCAANLIGENCDQPCYCYNGGVCSDDGECICPPGFSGEYCGETCEDGTFGANCEQTCHCADGSVCDNKMGTCTPARCQEGWTGNNCNERITCRNSDPCQNGGTCQNVDINQGYECICTDEFTGRHCEKQVVLNPCNPNPCENGGTCQRVGTGEEYECRCAEGFTGDRCENACMRRLILFYFSGQRLTTDFGLIVEYRGTTVSVSLHRKYREVVNGICGNCDGDKGNDCRGKGRSAARCGNQFAIGEDCDPGRPTDPCLENKEHKEDARERCDIISDENGPFSNCSEVVDRGALKEVCEYDLCATLPDLFLLCNHLENLVTICKNAGVDIGNWRASVPDCPFECPVGTEYNHCGNACPATCAWDEDENCGDECMETCECPENFVIADGKCIPKWECGCQLEDGRYLPVDGKSYNENCSETCTCHPRGIISCQTVTCHKHATCEMRAGEQRCYCKEGFDGNGQTCKPVGIRLIFQDKVYELIQSGAVIVDGQNRHLPYQDGNGVRISKNRRTVLQTDFGLKVVWNNRQTAVITLKKSAYFNNTCGLCGTCNDTRHDEFLTRDGATISNVIEFASSWKTGDRQCVDCPDCPTCETEPVDAQNACHAIIDPLGALAVCHAFAKPQQYYETCVYDLCAENSITNLCNNIKMYAEECLEAGGKVPFWYEDRRECEPACPEDMVYVPTPTNCPPSCADRDDDNCEVPLLGTCQCPTGLLIDGDKCVPSCGGCRLDDGSYLQDYPGALVSYTRAVRLEVGDHTYEVKTGGKVFIDGIQEPLPYEDEFVNIYFLFPRRVVIETSFQLSIIFRSPHTARVKVYHEMHLGRTCGLCGTCNRNRKDEFTLPNGELALTAAEFGNAWATDARECVDDPPEPPCEEDSEAEREAFDLCSVLTSVIDPVCPDGMVYDPCGSACQETCAGEGNDGCTFRCEEVCRCPDGQVLDGDECVARSECGCKLDSGGYLQVGEKWTNEDCTRHCKCTEDGIQCQDYSCPRKSTCDVKNGIRDCYCLPGYSMRDGACERVTICVALFLQTIITDFGLVVIYDNVHKAEIHLGAEYFGQTCGMCGTCTDDTSDDFKLQDGTITNSVADFGAAYRYNDTCETDGNTDNPCEEGSPPHAWAKNLCHAIIRNPGPFSECFDFLDPQNLYESCVMDVCVSKIPSLACSIMDLYFQKCWQLGAKIPLYWNEVPHCPANEGNPPPPIEEKELRKSLCELLREHRVANAEKRRRKRGAIQEISSRKRRQANQGGQTVGTCANGNPAQMIPPSCQATCDDVNAAGCNPNEPLVLTCICPLPLVLQGNECIGQNECPCDPIDGVRLETHNVNQFGNSWVTGNRQCQPPTGVDPCDPGSARHEAAKSQCFVLLNKLAPFSACHELVDPQPFYTSCVFDVCATNLNVHQLCGSIKNYVRRCRALQGNPGKWWTYVRQCAVPCPEGWEYTDCGTSCPATCEQPNGIPNCEDTCTETCLCPEGQVLDGTKCVFIYNCGCTLPNDVYLEQDQVYVNDDCSLQCTCDNGEATCIPLGCKGEEVCKVVGGERGCFCRDGTQWNGKECSDGKNPCLINILTSHFGLQLLFKYNIAGLKIEVSPDYYDKLCGMCGTCNSEESDDFLLPSLEQAESVSEFGKGWVTGDKDCSHDNGDFPCEENSNEVHAAEDLCFVLTNEGKCSNVRRWRPLRVCHEFVDPQPFFMTCVYDVCATNTNESLCANIDQYVQTCRRLGGNPGEWWKDVRECAAPCPNDMVYTQCGTGCPATCARRNQQITCNVEGIETCLCPEGKLLDGQRCVYPDECGCDTEDGTYISPGSVIITEGCTERCTCTLGQLECKPYQCHAQASCEIRSGDRDCYCSNGYIGNGQECEQADCECFIWGADSFRTFDHVKYSYNGGCDHILLKNWDSTITPFSLVGKFVKNDLLSELEGLRLEYNGAEYDINQDGILVKDGEVQSKTFFDGKVSILKLAGGNLVITTNFGLSVFYDGRTIVSIKVTAALRGKIFGMCGTCNNDESDDLTLPGKNTTTNIIEFGNQWAVDENCNPNADDQEACVEGTAKQVEAKDRCYPIVDPNGAFADCHDYLHPVTHYQTCIQDYCREEKRLCNSFTAYAAQCRSSGGNPQNWREKIKQCKFRCPRKYQYSSCTSGCPGSCVDLDGDEQCLHSCVEDCQCPFGLVLKESKCVKPDDCDCYVKEQRIIIPETVPFFLKNHNYWKFYTQDRDNVRNCAENTRGGWWMMGGDDPQGGCHFIHLNGDYENEFEWKFLSLRSSEMKIRPAVPTL
ncbi:IgGFc-binding protein [Holothuria leucospilota]|uniref:IgGFc-binding protein n=1 Tax=Holothuria leucospilota TaxID=206669 RepID=A0A9Q1BS17_HOLLE|nr:IgGFc-binding protein [Holothuria leucospilota]